MQQTSFFDGESFNQASLPGFPTKKETRSLLRVVQAQEQDYEFYPTCEQQILCIRNDILKEVGEKRHVSNGDKINLSVLDCGAGDGRALCSLTDGQRFAIEKSVPLIHAMDRLFTT